MITPRLNKPITMKEMAEDIFYILKEHNPEDFSKYKLELEKFKDEATYMHRIFLTS